LLVDAWGRFKNHHGSDAERLILEVGRADLEEGGDYQPGEFLNGDTGRNMGFPIQGWDASLFAAIYFGAFGLERVSPEQVNIRVRLANKRDFMTQLVLPGMTGMLSSHSGRLAWQTVGKGRALTVNVIDERE